MSIMEKAAFQSHPPTAVGRVISVPRKKPRMLRIFTLLLSLFILVVAPALAQEPVDATKIRRVFDVTRDGNKIGTTIIDIDKAGDTTTVKFTTHISVVVLFVEAYRYEASSTEFWKAGHFVSYKSRTNDNGTKHSVSAMAVADKFSMTVDGVGRDLPQIILPATLWNKDFVDATQLFDSEKGAILSINVKDLGDEVIQLNGANINAHHYKITGDFPRDIWLDGDVPVRIKLLGSDHSTILSDLRG